MREALRKKTTVVIADDHAIFRSGLRRILETVPGYSVVAETGDGAQTVAVLESFCPDLLILDITMPQGDGISVLRRLGREGGTRIVVLTALIQPDQLQAALQLGAAGVVLKGSTPELLLACIRTVLAGGVWIDQALAGIAVPDAKHARGAQPLRDRLTNREREIVVEIVAGSSNREIAEKLGISEDTAKRHLSNIFDKTGLSSRLELAVYAMNHSDEL